MHETLVELAQRHCLQPNGLMLPRISLHVATAPTKPVPTLYQPMLGMVLRGAKRVSIGDRILRYDPAHYFIGVIDVPAEVTITNASFAAPYVSIRLAIDQELLAGVAVDVGSDTDGEIMAFPVGAMPPELFDTSRRMLRLLDAPDEIASLAPLIEQEILFRLLRGPRGAVLRQVARTDSRITKVRHAIAHLRENFAEPLPMATLAEIVGMSPATFNRHFRTATAMSRLQYQKALRLQEARRRLIVDSDAASAGYAVGYESASQFSREYARMFGAPPRRDAARLRALAAA